MHDILNPSSLVKDFGYLGIFTALFLESGIIFGFFLPGDSLLFTAGLLASRHFLDIWGLIVISVTAAILGNNAGYYTGKLLGPSLFNKKGSFWFSPKRMEAAKVFFEKKGAQSLVLARFIPAVRTVVPIVAGIGKMSYRNFLLFNAIGGLLWGILLPLLGYTIGKTVPSIDKYLLPAVIVIVAVSLLPMLLPQLSKRRAVKLTDKL
jgi:membrane-associated protein